MRHPLLAWTGATIGVLAVAVAGGALSGTLESAPTPHPSAGLPPLVAITSTTAATTTTTAPPPPPTTTSTTTPGALTVTPELVAAVEAGAVSAMSLDIQAQELPASATPARHALVQRAWVPPAAFRTEAAYDRAAPAVQTQKDGAFVPMTWLSVTVQTTTVTVIVTGHYTATGATPLPNRVWTIVLAPSPDSWLIVSRTSHG